jgi:hypothetical protein
VVVPGGEGGGEERGGGDGCGHCGAPELEPRAATVGGGGGGGGGGWVGFTGTRPFLASRW